MSDNDSLVIICILILLLVLCVANLVKKAEELSLKKADDSSLRSKVAKAVEEATSNLKTAKSADDSSLRPKVKEVTSDLKTAKNVEEVASDLNTAKNADDQSLRSKVLPETGPAAKASVRLDNINAQDPVPPGEVNTKGSVRLDGVNAKSSVRLDDFNVKESVSPGKVNTKGSVRLDGFNTKESVSPGKINKKGSMRLDAANTKESAPPSDTESHGSLPLSDANSQDSTSPGHIFTLSSVPPGDIHTLPMHKIVFNGPYDDKHTHPVKITNAGSRRIGWAIKTTNMKRFSVDPPFGVLDPKESVLMAVSCEAFQIEQEDTHKDRITVAWTNAPDGAGKKFRRQWFQGNGIVRRKNLPVVYNP